MTTKERPILFSGPMVRAILEGRKTQTRRIVGKGNSVVGTGVPWDWLSFEPPWPDHCSLYPDGRPAEGGQYLHVPCKPHPDDPQTDKHWTVHRVYPRIEPGMRLWVREAHYVWSAGNKDGSGKRIDYQATEPDAPCSWTPSIHMPRWASRITLEVTAVRAERLQEISEEDAEKEGARAAFSFPGWEGVSSKPRHRWGFRELWESINGEGSWDVNPWVWNVCFKVVA